MKNEDSKIKVSAGILGFQGDIEEHESTFKKLGVSSIRVKSLEDLEHVTHLVLPGGESTVMSKFLKSTGLQERIKERIVEKSLQVYGTCAGAILLSKNIESPVPINSIGVADIKISRNAYGSQIDSFKKTLTFIPTNEKFDAIFIRAPKIENISDEFKVLVELDGYPVMIERDNILISTFHPELLEESLIHKYFLAKQ